MKTLVANFHFENGVIVSNINSVQVYYDENMCIDPKSDFIDRYKEIHMRFFMSIIRNQTMYMLECQLNYLLLLMEEKGYLYRGEMYDIMKNKEGMIVLRDTDYKLVEEHNNGTHQHGVYFG